MTAHLLNEIDIGAEIALHPAVRVVARTGKARRQADPGGEGRAGGRQASGAWFIPSPAGFRERLDTSWPI